MSGSTKELLTLPYVHDATGARWTRSDFHGAQDRHPAGGRHRTSTDGYPSRDLDLASNLSLTSDTTWHHIHRSSHQHNLQPEALFIPFPETNIYVLRASGHTPRSGCLNRRLIERSCLTCRKRRMDLGVIWWEKEMGKFEWSKCELGVCLRVGNCVGDFVFMPPCVSSMDLHCTAPVIFRNMCVWLCGCTLAHWSCKCGKLSLWGFAVLEEGRYFRCLRRF
jgi:hypothetical protein